MDKTRRKYLSEQINEIEFGKSKLALKLIKKNGKKVIVKLTDTFSQNRFGGELSNQDLIRKIISIKEYENAVSVNIIEV